MKLTKLRKLYLTTVGVLAGLTSSSQAQLIDGQTIGVDFGPTAPTNNFNQRNDTGTTNALIDLTGASVANVSVNLTSATGNPFSNNDADDTVGTPPAVFDSSNLTDWVGIGGDNGGLVITIAGLDSGLLYDLTIGHAFTTNTFTNGTTYSAGGQSATNADASMDPSFFDLNGLETDASGNLVITVTLPFIDGGDPEVPTVAALTLTANGTVVDTDGDGLSDSFETANSALGYDPMVDDSASDFDADGLTLAQEFVEGTDFLVLDTDMDGLSDGAEVNGSPATLPLVFDTDMDGLSDSEEVNGVPSSDPTLIDTDGDGFSDKIEIDAGTLPRDATSFPDTGIILNPSADGTYFEASATDLRINNDVIRVGGNNGGTIEFVGLILFDLDGQDITALQSETLTLALNLGTQDNTPVLDDLVVDYLGTFASDVLGTNGTNGADPNATTLATAPVVANLFTGTPATGELLIDATAIGSDAFTERYAVFRLTDPSVAAHQWDIADLSSATAARPAATFTIGGPGIPSPPSDLVLCIENDPAMAGNLLFSFNSEDGVTYDLRGSTDLSSAPSMWPIVVANVAADASGTNTESLPLPADPTTFYVVTEQ